MSLYDEFTDPPLFKTPIAKGPPFTVGELLKPMDDPPARKGPDPHDKQVGGTHYKDLELQPWDVMKSWFTNDEYRGFLRGNALKYIARYRNKGGVQDLEKSVHYLEALIAYEQETAERPA